MFAFPAGPKPYYSPDHTNPDQDFASVAAHAERMATLRSVIESPTDYTDYTAAEAGLDAHLGAIDFVQRGTKGVLLAMQSALADRFNTSESLNPASIKPDVVYANGVVYVRKQR